MKLLDLLQKEAVFPARSLAVMGGIAGISGALVLAVINKAAADASNAEHSFRDLAIFSVVIVLYIFAQRYIMTRSTAEVEKALHSIRTRMADKIRHSDLLTFERIGRSQIYAAVTKETLTISQTAMALAIGAQSAVLVFFTLFYVAVLSFTAFVLTMGFLGVAISIHLVRRRELNVDLHEAMTRENRLFDALTDLLDGLKEVKMSQARSADLFEHIEAISRSTTELKTRTQEKQAGNFIFSQTTFYLLLATIVFLVPKLSAEAVSSDKIVMVTTATLFLIGPISSVVGSIPVLAAANAAAENISSLEALLDQHAAAPPSIAPAFKSFETISLRGVRFEYADRSGAVTFQVGPVDLEIRAGEILFVSGGNGSGKSTFLKLLTGLYFPKAGTIRLDRTLITRENVQAYRNMFSVVFTDYRLFRRLFGLGDVDSADVAALLETMELADKTGLVDGEFTTLDLSEGQRKRLALLVSLLEQNQILVTDEWAANQDPEFRRKFYRELLPELKRQGKTIIAVTHDDRYFDAADRRVKMEEGRFVDI